MLQSSPFLVQSIHLQNWQDGDWGEVVTDFNLEICYHSGWKSMNTDTLSRSPIDVTKFLMKMTLNSSTSWSHRRGWCCGEVRPVEYFIWRNVTITEGKPQVLIGEAHAGAFCKGLFSKGLYKTIYTNYWWKEMYCDIHKFYHRSHLCHLSGDCKESWTTFDIYPHRKTLSLSWIWYNEATINNSWKQVCVSVCWLPRQMCWGMPCF